MKSRVLAEPVLVGRERELEVLMRYLDLAFEGKGTTVFVSGEAGSGKTRLTQEFLEAVKLKEEIVILSGRCLSNTAIPYLPFIEAFKAHFSPKEDKLLENDEAEINAWLTGTKQAEKNGKYRNLSPQAMKDLTFATITNAFSTIAACKPVILFLEDLHWADSASLSLLHYVARNIGSARVLVLATFRSEELTVDAEGYEHPLAEELRLMRRENLVIDIKLANLNRDYVAEVARNMMGGKVDAKLAEKLAEESRGNALYLVESLRMLSEQKQLVQEDNEWHLSVDGLNIPSKFKDIILRRLGALKFNQRRMLEAASVIGEKFNVELLGAVLAQDNLEVLEALNVILQSTSLLSVEEGFFRFDHSKSRETVYEAIPLPLKRGYHARVAERLEGKSGPLPLSDITYHYAQSGNTEKAVEYALASGSDELARFANAEAIEHFTYVLQNLPEKTDRAEKERIALEGLGDAYCIKGMFTKATEVFERLADFSAGKVKLRACRKAMDAVFFGSTSRKHKYAHLMALAKKAEPYADSDRLENARIRFHKAGALDSYKARGEEFEAALQVFEEEYSLPDVARALEAVGAAGTVYLEEKGLSMDLLATAMFEELGDLRDIARTTLVTASGFAFFGLLQEAWGRYAKVIQICEKIGDYKRAAEASLRLGRFLEVLEGRFDEALSKTLKAVEYFEKTDTPPREKIEVALVRQYAKAGKLEAAGENYEKLATLLSESRSGSNPNDILRSLDYRSQHSPVALDLARSSCEVARSLAIFSVATGRWKEAYQYFEEASVAAKWIGWPIIEVTVKSDYVWALQRQRKTEEANAQLVEIQRFFDEVDERFSHARLDAYFLAPRRVVAGEEFEMRLGLVNISRKPGLLVEVKGLVLPDLEVAFSSAGDRFENGSAEMKNRSVGPFQVETVKLKIRATKPGVATLNPEVTYTDEQGQAKVCKPKPITITIQRARSKYEVLPGRITTGLEELDALLFGGIPENHAVALTTPSTDEKELIVKRFLEAGAIAGETTFHITTETANTKTLAEEYPSNFQLIICNPQADSIIQNMPNVYRLKGVENLTDIDIALTKAFRTLKPSTEPKRICIEIVSDALLQHHAINTRRWLSALLPTLKLEGFTILATVNSKMHPQEEFEAILGLFDGEVRVTEKETPEGIRQTLRVRKLLNQKYLEKEIVLTKEKLS